MLNMYCFHIVFFLEMLQNEKFRNSMKDLWFVEREVMRAQQSSGGHMRRSNWSRRESASFHFRV